MSRYMILQGEVYDLRDLLKWEGLSPMEREIVQERIKGKAWRKIEIMNPKTEKPFTHAWLHQMFNEAIERRKS